MSHEKQFGRRDLLRAVGIGAAGALVGACEPEKDPFEDRPSVPGEPAWPSGLPSWVATTCGQCYAGCGIRVRVLDGRANHVAGNLDSPVNGAGVGPKGHAGLQVLYHPDRIRSPLKRVGERGSGEWRPIRWEQAISEVGRALRAVRAEPEGLVLIDGQPRGMMRSLWGRFLEAFGSPNHVDHRAATDGGKVLAMTHMHGVAELPAYDWAGARYVIGFGAGFFESWCQTIHFIRAAKDLRTQSPGQRTKFVLVSPRYSVTAAKSDQWVPIAPATYGALALGLAHVLVRDRRYDEEFVREHTFGFDAWTGDDGRTHRGFRDLVLSDYPPDRVSRITGVPALMIEQLADEMARNRPAISFADGGAAAATNGLGTAMAIHALNGLLGNLERAGGLLVQRTAPLDPWPAAPIDATARAGLAKPRLDGAGGPKCPLGPSNLFGVPDAILSERPYPAKALLLYRSNPAFSKPGGRRWIEAMRKVPLVVSFSPLPDESTIWADYVLPDHTYLETWDVVEPAPSIGYPVLGLRRPVVLPLHDTMATGEVVLGLAREIGGSVAAAFPWEKYREAVRGRLSALAGPQSERELEAGLLQRGTWSNPTHSFEQWEAAFRTPSGKFEFYSQSIAAKLREAFGSAAVLDAELERRGVATRGDDLCLPHWEPPHFAGAPDEFPFVLVAYRGIEYAEGGARHLPLLRELPLQGLCSWYDRIEINPVDAERLEIGVYETVAAVSPAGRGRFRAHLNPAIRPGTLGLPLGHGPWPPKPGVKRQVGGYALLVPVRDPLAGILALQGTRVRVTRIGS